MTTSPTSNPTSVDGVQPISSHTHKRKHLSNMLNSQSIPDGLYIHRRWNSPLAVVLLPARGSLYGQGLTPGAIEVGRMGVDCRVDGS